MKVFGDNHKAEENEEENMYGLVRYGSHGNGTPWGWFDNELARVAESVFRGLDDAQGATPTCNVDETKSGYVVSLDMPGVKRDEITIETRGRLLEVEATRKVRNQDTDRVPSRYRRAFEFPESANLDEIEATYEDGVLTIAVAKRESAKPKKIAVGQGEPGLVKKLLGGKEG